MGHGSPIVGQLKMIIGDGANGVAPRAAATPLGTRNQISLDATPISSASTQRKKLLTVA